jgi:hypothetical protein
MIYCDADWGGNLLNCKSVTGLTIFFVGGPIYWSLKFQRSVALLMTEAELTVILEATRQAIYTWRLLPELRVPMNVLLTIHNDNQGALKVLDSSLPPYHGCMKHYNIKVAHVCDMATKGVVHFEYCPTNLMPADILMKALSKAKFMTMRQHYLAPLPLLSEGCVKGVA